jgi:hypothetical protein
LGDSVYVSLTRTGDYNARIHVFQFYKDSISDRVVDVMFYNNDYIKAYDEQNISMFLAKNDTIEERRINRDKYASCFLHFFQDNDDSVTRHTLRLDETSGTYEQWNHRSWSKTKDNWTSEFDGHRYIHFNLDEQGLVQMDINLHYDSTLNYWKFIDARKNLKYTLPPSTFTPDESCFEYLNVCFTGLLSSDIANNALLFDLEQLVRRDPKLTFVGLIKL